MKLTVQLHSLSGSFASPSGKQSLFFVQSKRQASDLLSDWSDDHPRVGADEREAFALVWKGHLPDVTDQYPDFELSMGKRLGTVWNRC